MRAIVIAELSRCCSSCLEYIHEHVLHESLTRMYRYKFLLSITKKVLNQKLEQVCHYRSHALDTKPVAMLLNGLAPEGDFHKTVSTRRQQSRATNDIPVTTNASPRLKYPNDCNFSMIQSNSKTDSKTSGVGPAKLQYLRPKLGQVGQIDYDSAIKDLNQLQSNNKTVALVKYNNPEEILPVFATHLRLSGLDVEDLEKLKVIHVSGTKGKGSTCAFVESILRGSGFKTGFYNSPHLVHVTERIKINGQSIDTNLFVAYFRKVYDKLAIETQKAGVSMPTYFSFMTLLAFHVFIGEQVDCAIVEVGIGGQYDPTNIIPKPIACGITTLDYDHTNILGNTIEDIAWAKAGIAKPGVPLFTVVQDREEAMRVIRGRAIESDCPLVICRESDIDKNIQLGIRGSAQYVNAALAINLASYFLQIVKNVCRPMHNYSTGINLNVKQVPDSMVTALQTCSWPGRCQIVRYPRITFFLDGAHTKKSMENCLEWFSVESPRVDPSAEQVLLINVIGDRDKSEVMKPLSLYNNFSKTIFSTNKVSKGNDGTESETFTKNVDLAHEKTLENARINLNIWMSLNNKQVNDISMIATTTDSVKHLLDILDNNDSKIYHVLVTGSLHFVGAMYETISMMDIVLKKLA